MKKFCFALSIALLIVIKPALGSEAGMPQLDSEFWASQIFWLVLIFSLLYLTIWKIFLPRITYSIENRKSKIVNDLNEAQKLKENAEKKLNEYNKIIEDSKKEAKKIIDENRKKLDKDIATKKQKFDEEIEKELMSVEKEIKNFKNSSVSNVAKIAATLSTDIISQIINTETNKSNVTAIVNDIIKKKVENKI